MQGKEREKNYSLETICSQLELCHFGLETKLETPNPVPPPPGIYLFSTHFKINILTSLSRMPPCYKLIGYNIPQLCAWKLGFSPLNTRTTSAGKTITAASAPLHYALPAGGWGGGEGDGGVAPSRRSGDVRGLRGHRVRSWLPRAALLSGRQALGGLDADKPGKGSPNSLCFGEGGNEKFLFF